MPEYEYKRDEFNDRFTLRDVELADIDILLSWRNSPESLSASPSSRRIEPIEHRQFMHRRIPLGNWWMLTHDPVDSKPVDMGVVRFDRRTFHSIHSTVRFQEAFMTSIYVAEQFRGQCVASSMISMGVKRLKLEGLRFLALIKVKNLGSEMAFERARFKKWLTIEGADRGDWMIYQLLNPDIMG